MAKRGAKSTKKASIAKKLRRRGLTQKQANALATQAAKRAKP